jgi:TldD protein
MSTLTRLDRREVMGLGVALATASTGNWLWGCATGNATRQHEGSLIVYFSRFGVDEELVRHALSEALAFGGERADVFIQHRHTNMLVLEDGDVNRAHTSVSLGAGVRVIKGDQQGYAYTEELTAEALKRAARTAAAIADGGPRPGPQAFRADALPQRYPLKRRWDDVKTEEKLPLLVAVNAAVFARDARIKKVTVSFADESSAVLIADSSGRIAEDIQPMTRIMVGCVAEQDGRREQNGWNVAGRTGFDWYTRERLDKLVNRAVDKTLVLFDAAPAPVGEMPVVLGAGPSGILLHEAIGHGMEADFNRKGTSVFSDKIGKAVAKPFVSIVDDGTQEAARGALNVDDEGNSVGKTMLVEGGTLASYLHDSISAKHYGVKPTGNGRRESYQHVPMPRMRSTYMLPGPHKRDEIIASVKQGLFCDGFSNGQVNIGPGDFTFYVTNGYLIENGRLTRPVEDLNIIGNGPRVLELIDMVADDLEIDEGGWTCGKNGQSVPVSQGMPSVRVSKMTVGGRSA